jgi:hypothetical protein
MVAVQNLKGVIIQLILSRKGGGGFWTASIFIHAHLQVVYYNCVKFHKNPISRIGGVALTRYTTLKGLLVAVQNLEGEIIQLVPSRKEGGYVPCKRNYS